MSKKIRELIYENKGDISSIDLNGTKLRHPNYGMGTIVKYCDCCYQLDIKYEGKAEKTPSHFDAVFGEHSKFKLSKKQLEQKFGHLRENASPQKAQFLCTTPPVVTPAVAKAVREGALKRLKKSAAKPTVRRKGLGKRPPGAIPLFK